MYKRARAALAAKGRSLKRMAVPRSRLGGGSSTRYAYSGERGGFTKKVLGAGQRAVNSYRKAQRFLKDSPMRSGMGSLGAKAASVAGGGIYTGGRGMYTGGRGMYDPGMSLGLDRIRGSGLVSANALLQGGTNSQPAFSNAGDDLGGICVTHMEYVTDVYGNPGTPFEVQQYAINPGLDRFGPWLAQLAANFEEYEFIQLGYRFRSTIGELSSTSGQVGSVIMTTNYNPSAEPFSDKVAMMQYAGACSGKTTDDLIHMVECDPRQLSGPPGRYVRTGTISADWDLKMYDKGTFMIGISGTPDTVDNSPIGELWLSYKCILRKPKLGTTRGGSISTDMFASLAESYFYQTPFGNQTSILTAVGNTLGGQLTASTGTAQVPGTLTYTFPSNYVGQAELRLNFYAQPFVQGDWWTQYQDWYGLEATVAIGGNITTLSDYPNAAQNDFAYIWQANGFHPSLQTTLYVQNETVDDEARTQVRPVSLLLRVYVQPPSGGVDNQVTIQFLTTGFAVSDEAPASPWNPGPNFFNPVLIVTEYNQLGGSGPDWQPQFTNQQAQMVDWANS